MKLVVSIHDVSPLTQSITDEVLTDLSRIGVVKTSLLVIPDHHHKAPVAGSPHFQKWLTKQAANGHEMVVHGYFHQRDITGPESMVTRGMTSIYTAGEGEFYDITKSEASEKLGRALRDFDFLEHKPVGFIAPAWLLSEQGEAAVRKAGFRYTTRLREVVDLVTGTREISQSLVYSTRAAWRRQASLLWNAALLARMRRSRLLRVGIHPPDWKYPSIRDQIVKLCAKAATSREVLTYEQWISQ